MKENAPYGYTSDRYILGHYLTKEGGQDSETKLQEIEI